MRWLWRADRIEDVRRRCRVLASVCDAREAQALTLQVLRHPLLGLQLLLLIRLAVTQHVQLVLREARPTALLRA